METDPGGVVIVVAIIVVLIVVLQIICDQATDNDYDDDYDNDWKKTHHHLSVARESVSPRRSFCAEAGLSRRSVSRRRVSRNERVACGVVDGSSFGPYILRYGTTLALRGLRHTGGPEIGPGSQSLLPSDPLDHHCRNRRRSAFRQIGYLRLRWDSWATTC